jgi:hypothetical protein
MLYSFAAAPLGPGKIIKHPMPFFAVLLVDVQRPSRLLTDEQDGGNLYRITTETRLMSLIPGSSTRKLSSVVSNATVT